MRKNRIFISFAIEDRWAKERLVGQAKNQRSLFEFLNMSVNEPFDEKGKTQCRIRIKGCDGVIALVSKNTARADGAIWEVKLPSRKVSLASPCTPPKMTAPRAYPRRILASARWTGPGRHKKFS